MKHELVVAAAQMESVPGAIASNVDKHLSMLAAAAARLGIRALVHESFEKTKHILENLD